MLPRHSPDADDKYGKYKEGGNAWRLLLLGVVVIWQVHTLYELTTYEGLLSESRDKHASLQEALTRAQERLIEVHGNSSDCIIKQRGERSRTTFSSVALHCSSGVRGSVALCVRVHE